MLALPKQGARDMAGLQILLVEDEFLIRMDLAFTLEDLGHRVEQAQSADAAMKLLEGGCDFDLLITDIDMPGTLDGIALAFAACDLRPRCLILILSGGQHPHPTDIPADSVFLSKPVSPSALKHAISTLQAA